MARTDAVFENRISFRAPTEECPLKLLYLITKPDRGGAQIHVLELMNRMRERAEVALATSEPGYLTDAAQGAGIEVHFIRNLVHAIHPVRDLAAIREIRTLLLSIKPDLLHCHSSKAGLVGRVAA